MMCGDTFAPGMHIQQAGAAAVEGYVTFTAKQKCADQTSGRLCATGQVMHSGCCLTNVKIKKCHMLSPAHVLDSKYTCLCVHSILLQVNSCDMHASLSWLLRGSPQCQVPFHINGSRAQHHASPD